MRARTYIAFIFAMVACAGVTVTRADEEEEEPDIDEGLVGLVDESGGAEMQPEAAAVIEDQNDEEEPDIEEEEPDIDAESDTATETVAEPEEVAPAEEEDVVVAA